MKPMNDKHLAILRRHMVELVEIQVELFSDELGQEGLENGYPWNGCRCPRHSPREFAAKMSNRYLGKLLVVGAHAVLYHRKGHVDALRHWACKLMQTKPFKLVAVALANKLARIAFAIMRSQSTYAKSECSPA
jgi:hypothetical protein